MRGYLFPWIGRGESRKMLDMFRDIREATFGFFYGVSADRSRSCDQEGDWGREADVWDLVDNFSDLWRFLWVRKVAAGRF